MKIKNVLLGTTLLVTIIADSQASAQPSVLTNVLQPAVENKMPEQQKLTSSVFISFNYEKALKDFENRFGSVSNARWSKACDDIVVKFKLAEISNIVYYSHEGKWVGSMKGYNASRLAPEIASRIRQSYLNYKITWIQEVRTLESGSISTFIFNIEDGHKLKVVRLSDDEFTVLKEFVLK